MDRERPLMEHLQELRGRLFKIAIVVGVITALSVMVTINMQDFNGYKVPIPNIDPFNNVSIQLMAKMKNELLPPNVELVQLAPGQAFFAQFYIALLLGIIIAMPVIVREMAGFVGPALHQNEKGMVKSVIIPAVGLFAAGIMFSYYVVIPYILNFLYVYGESIGVKTFLNITEFITFVMQLLVAFGISYELPVTMWAASKAGMVEPKFWRNNIRWAVILIAAFGAVITPDGSGVTMWFVAAPMIALYVIGMVIIEKKIKAQPEAPVMSEREKLAEIAKSLGIDFSRMSDEELRMQIEKRRLADGKEKGMEEGKGITQRDVQQK
jgi:sec-independent protein translocase protein TatC